MDSFSCCTTSIHIGDGSICMKRIGTTLAFRSRDVFSAFRQCVQASCFDPPKKTWPQALRAWTNRTRSNGTRQSTGEDKARNAKNSAKFVSEDRGPDRWWTG